MSEAVTVTIFAQGDNENTPAEAVHHALEYARKAGFIEAWSEPVGVAQEVPERGSLTRLAAECHRSKWQFDLSEDYKPTARVARDMILRAFRELHRIGDLAMKLRDASPLPSTEHQSHPVWEDENRWMCEHGRQGGCSCRFTCKGYGAVSSTNHSGET